MTNTNSNYDLVTPEGVADFLSTAKENRLKIVKVRSQGSVDIAEEIGFPEPKRDFFCYLRLRGQITPPLCEVICRDGLGNFTVLTSSGKIFQALKDEVRP